MPRDSNALIGRPFATSEREAPSLEAIGGKAPRLYGCRGGSNVISLHRAANLRRRGKARQAIDTAYKRGEDADRRQSSGGNFVAIFWQIICLIARQSPAKYGLACSV